MRKKVYLLRFYFDVCIQMLRYIILIDSKRAFLTIYLHNKRKFDPKEIEKLSQHNTTKLFSILVKFVMHL